VTYLPETQSVWHGDVSKGPKDERALRVPGATGRKATAIPTRVALHDTFPACEMHVGDGTLKPAPSNQSFMLWVQV